MFFGILIVIIILGNALRKPLMKFLSKLIEEHENKK